MKKQLFGIVGFLLILLVVIISGSGCASNPQTQPDLYAPLGERHVKIKNYLFEPIEVIVNGEKIPEPIEQDQVLILYQNSEETGALDIIIKRKTDGKQIQRKFPPEKRSRRFYGSVDPIKVFYPDFNSE